MRYDKQRFYLGKLCHRGHRYRSTEFTLRLKKKNDCPICRNIRVMKSNVKIGPKFTYSKVVCMNCNITFSKTNNAIKRSIRHFCSRSCSCSWHNTNKTYGFRRSKIEKYIETNITDRHQQLDFCFNDRKRIGLELDILIPTINLAIEINGITHYKPIFGKDKFETIRSNDKKKYDLCQSKGIELHVIDISSIDQSRFKNILDQIDNIIISVARIRT
jgi:hypothetical protein